MAGLVDLNNAVNAVLRSKAPYHKIYAREVKEGFQRPSFFVQIIPMAMDYETKNYKSDRLMVAITYFNEHDTELENIKMHDQLVDAFGRTLQVGERHLDLNNIRSADADSALQFSFDLDYWSYLHKEEQYELQYELMRELEIKTEEE